MYCQQQIQEKIERARQGMQQAQEASNQDTKSSAGDKYETGRAMAQLEKDKYARQLAELMKSSRVLSEVEFVPAEDKARIGSLVETSMGSFYLAVSLGKAEISSKSFFLVSGASPIGRQLIGKSCGDTFVFNGRSVAVTAVF